MNQMLRQPLTDSDIRRRTQIFTILDEIGEDLDLTETQFDRARQSYGAVGDWLSDRLIRYLSVFWSIFTDPVRLERL